MQCSRPWEGCISTAGAGAEVYAQTCQSPPAAGVQAPPMAAGGRADGHSPQLRWRRRGLAVKDHRIEYDHCIAHNGLAAFSASVPAEAAGAAAFNHSLLGLAGRRPPTRAKRQGLKATLQGHLLYALVESIVKRQGLRATRQGHLLDALVECIAKRH